MFKNNKDNEIITQLREKIQLLEKQLNEVANDNGSIIVKQLPNGQIELNGIAIDNTTEIEYYNSSQATFGELTMFRIGKEAKQREMNKLISTHMDEIDEFNIRICELQDVIVTLEAKSKLDNDTIATYEKSEADLKMEISNLKNQIEVNQELSDNEKQVIIKRYDGMINALEDDIRSWKKRYLEINNVSMDGTIITKYGKIISKGE